MAWPRMRHGITILALGAGALGCGTVHRSEPGGDGDGGAEDGGDDGENGDDGNDDAGPAPAELCVGASGERIRRVIRRHDDGTSEAIALRDTEFGGNCQFQPDREGTLRCMPVQDGRPFGIAQRYYTDSACTSMIADFSFVEDAPPGYAVGFEGGTCSIVFHYYELGAQLSFPEGTTIYYLSVPGGVCTPTTADSSPGTRYFQVTSEIPLERFVAGAESIGSAGRLGVRQVEGDDGSRSCERAGSLRDSALGGHPCSLAEGEDRVSRCLPQPISLTSVSTDIQCANPIDAAEVSTCGAALDYTQEAVEPRCYSRWRIRDLGEELTGTLYRDTFDGCSLAPADNRYFRTGEVVDPTDFAELAQERVALGGRLERIDLVGDGVRVDRPIWYDTEIDAVCDFRSAADGAIRCLPGPTQIPEAYATTFYSDSSCKVQTAEHAFFNDGCETGREPRYVVKYAGGYRLFALGEPITEPRYWWEGGCAQVPASTRLYSIGAEVALDSFVSGSEEVEAAQTPR